MKDEQQSIDDASPIRVSKVVILCLVSLLLLLLNALRSSHRQRSSFEEVTVKKRFVVDEKVQ